MKSFDPTHTMTLQRQFASKLRGELYQLGSDIEKWFQDPSNWIDFIEAEITANAGNSKWSFSPKGSVLAAFTLWLNKKVDRGEVSKSSDGFVTSAFDRGVDRAESYAPKEVAAVTGVFRAGTMIERLKILRTQATTAIKGLKDRIKAKVIGKVADGMLRGDSPRKIGRDINKEVRSVSKKDATRIARTEVVRAHAEGSLDRLESMGVTHVGVEVEWSATKLADGSFEPRVCKQCRAMDGLILPIERAHGLIPRHPNCRCAFIPALDKSNKDKIRKAVRQSIEAGKSKKQKKEEADLSTAANKPARQSPSWPGPAITDYLKK